MVHFNDFKHYLKKCYFCVYVRNGVFIGLEKREEEEEEEEV